MEFDLEKHIRSIAKTKKIQINAHPPIGEQFNIANPNHSITAGLDNFSMVDELYLLEIYPPITTLITCDFKGFSYPIA